MQIAWGKAMEDAHKFEDLVQFRAPTNLSKAIDTAARERCQSKSDYIRQSIVDRLRSDGIHLRGVAGRAACALLVCALVASSAMAAGTIPISMTQQFDSLGKPLVGGQLFLIKAGTVAEPQNCFQDVGLTIPWPNPITLDAAGRVPQLFCADGSIKIRLTSKTGVSQLVADSVLVIGPSSGGGGGSSVDQTTLLQTGQMIDMYATGVLTGFVRCNGRSIGGTTSGATERANSDTQALFNFLWQQDPNLAVSGGRGASSASDFAANKTLSLPDCRARVRAGLGDMGNTDSGRLTATYFGASPVTLGATGGTENQTLTIAQMPSHFHSASIYDPGHTHGHNITGVNSNTTGGGGFTTSGYGTAIISAAVTGVRVNSSNGLDTTYSTGGGGAHPIVQPTLLVTTYIRL
ncbi:hypothetical protein ACNJYD_04420 [Bradyrhizobium sp. DASA03005]|uniref:hypothetical protein n=1 Tax=Bradyrhizobium sp. SPXBL-02 TaxID=3395912 RepID=UPI003F70FDEC